MNSLPVFIAAAIIAALMIAAGDSRAIETCKKSHSYETCVYEVAR